VRNQRVLFASAIARASLKDLNVEEEIFIIGLMTMPKPYIFRLEENKAIIRRMVEASNKKDLATIDQFIDEYMEADFVDHSSQLRGRENVKQGYAAVSKDYPDFHRIIEDIIAEGDKVWFLEKVSGTDPSGKKMDATTLSILRMVNGKFVEGWGGYLHNTP